MDWKIIAMEVNEAKEKGIKNQEDFLRLYPGGIDEIKDWFRMYKTLEGGKENEFVSGG